MITEKHKRQRNIRDSELLHARTIYISVFIHSPDKRSLKIIDFNLEIPELWGHQKWRSEWTIGPLKKSLTAVNASKHRMFEAKINNTDCLKQ